jgi:hypothetical protein
MEDRDMAKRMRRTKRENSAEQQSTTGALAAQARDVSVSAVKVATATARAALAGMQELGRVAAGMAAPAARRALKTAGEVTQATVESARPPRALTPPAPSTRSQRSTRSTRAKRKGRTRRAA